MGMEGNRNSNRLIRRMLPCTVCSEMTTLGRGGAGQYFRAKDSVPERLADGHKIGTVDMSTVTATLYSGLPLNACNPLSLVAFQGFQSRKHRSEPTTRLQIEIYFILSVCTPMLFTLPFS